MIRNLLVCACLFAPMLVAAQDQKPAQTAPAKKTEHKGAMAKKFHCDACNMDIKGEKAMRAHMKKAHGKGFYCAECNKWFKDKAEMKSYMDGSAGDTTKKADKPAEPAPATK